MGFSDDQDLTSQDLAEIAKAREALGSFINLHFMTLLDAAFIERARAPEFTSVLLSLANEQAANTDIATGASMMSEYLEQTKFVELSQLVNTLGVDRTRLYRSVSKGYGPPPPYEMVWSNKASDHDLLVTIAKIYAEAGLTPSPEAKERLDYIGLELEFILELAKRETIAWESNERDEADKLLSIQHVFMSQHIGQWVPDFIEKAQEYVKTNFYKGHLTMLRGYITQQMDELAYLVSEV